MKSANDVFVFGSNLSGYHGAGAAKYALNNYGAVWGRGVGLYGQSYALPTKDRKIQTLPISEIDKHIADFIQVVARNPEKTFWVTRIGCGLAGYTDDQIAPLFTRAFLVTLRTKTNKWVLLNNIRLPKNFLDILCPNNYHESWISFTE